MERLAFKLNKKSISIVHNLYFNKGLFMKIFPFLLLLTSVTTFACPNLAGNYSCKEGNEAFQITITQTVVNGATVYHHTSGEDQNTYTADGVARPHTVNAEGQTIVGTLKTTCSNSTVNNIFQAIHMGMEIVSTETVNLGNEGLHVVQVTNVDGDEYRKEEYNCKRSN